MKTIAKIAIGVCVLWSTSTLAAQPIEYWGCKFNDGKSMDDLMAWTEKWNKVADTLSDQSYSAWVMTPMFSESMSQYDFIWGGAWGSYQVGWVTALSTGTVMAFVGAALWLFIRADHPFKPCTP